jgi:DNA-binding XRE family transcriptional regulator
VNQTLQQRFRELRHIRGVSGIEIAEKMGVTKGYVSLIESGKRLVVDPAKLLKLASKLAVNSEWLLTGYGDPSKPTDPTTLSVMAGLTPPHTRPPAPGATSAGTSKHGSISSAAAEVRKMSAILRDLCVRVDRLEKRLSK